MCKSSLTTFAFTTIALLAGCSSNAAAPGGTTATAGASNVANGGATASGGASAGKAGNQSSGGTNAAGANSAGGASASGGASHTGGANNSGGANGSGGASTAGGASSSGGTSNNSGGSSSGGAGADVDQMGKANAAPGDKTSTVQDYLRLGEIRLLNNNWGSQALGCTAPTSTMSVFINTDKSFGWTFSRGDCDKAGSNQDPDFPQIEFGIHPFGIGSSLATSPNFSSTTLLPLQVKDFQTASVTIDSLNVSLQNQSSWDITFEFWLSQRNPVTDPNPGVYSELMTFWGWQTGRWPDAPNGTGPTGNGAGAEVKSGDKTYKLWVQDDMWSNGQWRYFQFRAEDGPQKTFNGTLNIKALMDYLVNTRGYSSDLWVSRFEVGSEIDDNTSGTVTLKGITFEVNGQTRSQVFKQ